MIVARCLLFVVRLLLIAVCCSWFVVRCLVVCGLCVVVRCFLFKCCFLFPFF